MAVRVVTDSTCDLPRSIVDALGITVVPLTVRFGNEAFLDGVDIDVPTFYERLVSSPVLPKTSQPSVEQFREVYEAIGETGDEIVSIHVSSRLSGTLNSASIARENVPPGVHIELIDSYSVSMGLGAIVVEAAEAALRGGSRDEVTAIARRAMDHTGLAAALDTLEYLQKGGRIGRARGLLGSILSVKPIIHLEDGEIAPLDRVRTRKKAVARMEEIAIEHPHAKKMYICTTGNDDEANQFIDAVRRFLPHTEFVTGSFGPVVGVYAGPNALGVSWLDRD